MKRVDKKGITLVELVMSVFIFSFIMLSVFSLYSLSVVESYKQSRGIHSHISGTGSVEKHEMGVLQNVDKAKEISLFNGLGSVASKSVQLDITATTFGTNKASIVSANPSGADLFSDLKLEHGRVGYKFANLLMPQDVFPKSYSVKEFPIEYKNKIAPYFVNYGSVDLGDYKHGEFDFRKFSLPKGKYRVKYYLYDRQKYEKLIEENKDAYLQINTTKYQPLNKKDIALDKGDKFRFVSSKNDDFITSEMQAEFESLKLPVTKGNVSGWTFFNKDTDNILPPGYYFMVFELTLTNLSSSENESQAIRYFKSLPHLSKITRISDMDHSQKLIARDIVFVESLKPNVFVNAGKELYIGSNFDGYNLTKQELGRDDGVIEFIGELPNADFYTRRDSNGKIHLPSNGLIYNHSNNNGSTLFTLKRENIGVLGSNQVNFSKGHFDYYNVNNSRPDYNILTYSQSLSPYGNNTAGVTFFIDGKNQILHSDSRYQYIVGGFSEKFKLWTTPNFYKAKNKRLFNSDTLNIALLEDGQLLLSDAYRYRHLNTNERAFGRYYRKSGGGFSDLYVNVGEDANNACRTYLGLKENGIKKIYTNYKVEDTCSISDVKFIYAQYKNFPISEEMERISNTEAISGKLRGFTFEKFFPLEQEQYLILAKKGKLYRLFSLFKDPQVMEVRENVVTDRRIQSRISHSKTVGKREKDEEKDVFKAEVINLLMKDIKSQVEAQANDLKENLERRAKAQFKVDDEEALSEAVKNFVNVKLEEKIIQYLNDDEPRFSINEKTNFWGTNVTFSTDFIYEISDFDFIVDSEFEYAEYTLSETLYPDIESGGGLQKEAINYMYGKVNQLGFESYGNDLYAYAGNRMYHIIPRAINNATEVFNPPVKILETTHDIKNVYIHNKNEHIEVD